MNDAEAFVDKLREMFGKENSIHAPRKKEPGLPPVAVFVFHDLPERGMITGITYGLSLANHPAWKHARPELILTLKTTDEGWLMAMGVIADSFRGDCPFSYGNVLTAGEPLVPGAKMEGFFVFAPSFLTIEQATFDLPSKRVILSGMYPIYPGEAGLIRQIGLDRFWHTDGFDLYKTDRPDLSTRPTE